MKAWRKVVIPGWGSFSKSCHSERQLVNRTLTGWEETQRGSQVSCSRCFHTSSDGVPTFADAEATDPAAVMPRLTAMSLLDVVTATVTGVGRREGMTGSGRSPGRLLPLTTAEAQL